MRSNSNKLQKEYQVDWQPADFHGNWDSPSLQGAVLDEIKQGNFPEVVTGKVRP